MVSLKVSKPAMLGLLLSTTALVPVAVAQGAPTALTVAASENAPEQAQSLDLNLTATAASSQRPRSFSFNANWDPASPVLGAWVRVFDADDTSLDTPIAEVAVDRDRTMVWQVPKSASTSLKYVVRIVRPNGTFSETAPASIHYATKVADSNLSADEPAVAQQAPVLSAGLTSGEVRVAPGQEIEFETLCNYCENVDRATISIFNPDDKVITAPVAVLPVHPSTGRVTYRVPMWNVGRYTYVYRVYDKEGRYDETAPQLLDVDFEQKTATGFAVKATEEDLSVTRQIPVNGEVRPAAADGQLPAFRVLVGGRSLDTESMTPDHKRYMDYRLDRADIQMSYDGLSATPLLNISLDNGGVAAMKGDEVSFVTYWNYDHWIDHAAIFVYDDNDELITAPIAVLPVDVSTGSATWRVPLKRETSRYRYALRVYGADEKFDETAEKFLTIVEDRAETEINPDKVTPIYGLDATASRNIQVRGASVTVSGKSAIGLPVKDVRVFGRSVKTDQDGDFAVRQIVPAGAHRVDVSYKTASDRSVKLARDIDVPKDEFFFVAIGDLTVGTRSDKGRALVEASGEEFDETYITGRGAFYLKGKIKGKYLLTASMDTTEDDIDNLFSNLSDKDPQSLLRRLDPDRYYPVYGDDSTYIEDAPTQGRFYVRLEDGDNNLVWGNFTTNMTATEFAQIDRGLYGAKAEYNSDETTEFGARKSSATLFAADPGTIPSREEYRATGGSVYFLENQDLTIGSERLRVEYRDQDSGLVTETRDLQPFVDYDVDYIQGRVLLSRPLSSTVLGDQIVRDGTLSGQDVYLVARYEYTPGLDDIDGYTTGGRLEKWFGNEVRVGVTAQQEETGDADQTLMAYDVVFRKSDATYAKVEVAQTDGAGFEERASIDGGFTFNQLSAAESETTAQAARVELAANSQDFSAIDRPLRVSAYAEILEQGFSGVGRLTQDDTIRAGAAISGEITDNAKIALKYDSLDIQSGLTEETMAADLRVDITEKLNLGVGLRFNDVDGSTIGRDGARTDLGVEARYQFTPDFGAYGFAQGSLSVADARQTGDRYGGGVEAQLSERIRLKGEASGGAGGTGALGEVGYTLSEGEEYYLNYALDAERTEPGVDGTSFLSNSQNALTAGGRKRFNSIVSVYGEERATFGDTSGLTHAYGIDLSPTDRWNIGASTEIGELEEQGLIVEREAYTVSAGYAGEQYNFGGAFEWLHDESNGAVRETWLFRSNLGVQVSPDWRALLKFNKAESNFSGGAFFNGDFTEAQLAGAYRPVDNDRLNMLARLTYFEDLTSAAQISNSGQNGLPAQKSTVFSIDGNYRLNHWLTLGGKIGHRSGEVSLSRLDEDFVESNASLFVARADVHFVKRWDAVLEGRMLDVDLAGDTKKGVLAAVYRHIGDNAKIGLGYNFTDFSDDLTDLSFNDDGLFLNIVAKF